ncbi:hypothetical protein AWL03_14550 [Listeria monocytogenes]|uniref:DUF3383 family protein n=1 Tax=Listeria monocytogenes TaxID=1639 RepID=UPI000BDFD899|nr:DUF3383 family protein [Listeria monocytogenes]PCZ07325.1 hypothetical protein A7N65_07275 [Listeria monocytogenes]PDG13445.1 hypothetical protein AWL03_14550 [Listeria monocytogenes]
MVETITDVRVHISVLYPSPRIGLGRPAIFVQGLAMDYKEYTSVEALKETFDETTAVYAKAKAVFLQKNAPDLIAVVTYEEGKMLDAAEAYFLKSWHFAVLADYSAADALALSNFVEEQQFKFAVFQVATATEITPLVKNTRTIVIVHSKVDEKVDAALLGNVANLPVGSVTWKGRYDLKGVTAEDLKATEIDAIQQAGGLCYIEKAGIAQTSDGKTVSGEFIDAIHGDDWIKSTIETRLQKLLTETDKLTFDAQGIALLQGELTTVLNEGFTNGIIDRNDETGEANYSITALQRADLSEDDIAKRNYKGLSFRYKRSGAIHSVDVYGEVEV